MYKLTPTLNWSEIKNTQFSASFLANKKNKADPKMFDFDVPDPRFGHSVVAYESKNKTINSKLYIFGGEARYSVPRNKRELFNDLYQFDIVTEKYKQLDPSGNLPEGRKHHASCIVGQYMFVHGGIDQSAKVMNELLMFDIVDTKWTKINFKSKEVDLNSSDIHLSDIDVDYNPKLYGHTMIAIFEQERYRNIEAVNLWYLPELSKLSKKVRLLRHEGILSFGGYSHDLDPITGMHTNNNVRLLSFGYGEKEWITLQTSGQPPRPRY